MPSFSHQPVLLKEVLEALRPRDGGRYVDGTTGGAGHAAALLEASSPTGWLCGFDRDADAIEAARHTLKPYEGRYELCHANFCEMDRWIEAGTCDGVLLDLGVSSHQLDEAQRGFSFQQEGPLDMRMDRRQSRTAADLVNEADEQELSRLFWEWGEEPQARRMARALVRERQKHRLETTGQLARCIERVAPRRGKKRHPATRVFMALRMAINDEVMSLKSGLAAACSRLRRGGRLAVITFHSVEDRVVKQFGTEHSRGYRVQGPVDLPDFRVPQPPPLRRVTRKPVTPSAEELTLNARARSAKLRVLEVTGNPF